MGDQYLGVIQMVAYAYAPLNFTFCSGQLIPIPQNNALFSLLGDAYGGDARTVFGVPDLRARMPVGSNIMGNGPGLTTYNLGTKVGLQTHTLTERQLPAHNHAAVFTPSGGEEVTGTLEAYSTRASTDTPDPGSYISGGGAPMFGTGGLGAQLVELAGLTVTGGGGGGGTVTVGDTGEGQPFEIVNPMQTVNFVICTAGLYPSRN
jgi:microcystin-dependent protein